MHYYKRGEATKAAAKDLVAYGLEGLGWTPDEAGKAFDDYIAYEKLLFEHLYSIAQMYSEDFVQEYKYTDREGLQEMMKEFPIQGILDVRGFGKAKEICYDNGDYLKHLGDLYTQDNLEMLKNYYIVSYLLEFANECDSRSNALSDKVLGAAYSQLNTDSFTDLDNVFNYYKSSLSNAMNKAYLARHDVSDLKAETAALFEDIKTTYRDMLMAEDYFKGITIFEGHTYNGISTLEEAIADITGFGAMLALAENDENFDHDKFFRVYAEHLRHLSSYEQDAYNLTSDAHPLNNLRVNVIVQQYEKFYETYDVKEGDTMYLAPEDRICIW